MDEVKGTSYLIKAIKEMGDVSGNSPKLLIVGDGPLKDQLLLQAKELGIEKQVSFFGKRPHKEISLWMNAVDLFCLPSIREGMPNVLIESLACGTPAVASAVGAVPEMIKECNGRVSRLADTKSLRDQIVACLKQPWDRQAIRNSAGTLSWDDCALSYLQCYQEAIDALL